MSDFETPEPGGLLKILNKQEGEKNAQVPVLKNQKLTEEEKIEAARKRTSQIGGNVGTDAAGVSGHRLADTDPVEKTIPVKKPVTNVEKGFGGW